MNSHANAQFWSLFAALPADVQRKAYKAFAHFQIDPFYPALQFKEVGNGLWSARVDAKHRVLGRRNGDTIRWFWIGTHDEYERLIAQG